MDSDEEKMIARRQINYKTYFLISLGLTLLLCLLAKSKEEIYGIFIVYFAVIINQILLVKAVDKLIDSQMSSTFRQSKSAILMLFVGKLIVLLIALTLSVQIMGNRIIIPLINYVLMIFVLNFSMKK